MKDDSLVADLSLHALREQIEVVNETKAKYHEEVQVRDELIRGLLDAGIPYRRLARFTGLSRSQLVKIKDSM